MVLAMKLFETKLSPEDVAEVSAVLRSGQLGFGPNVPKFENEFAKFSGKLYNISTNSASASAFMIFAYFFERYGVCDVYTTTLGFTSPAWAAKHFGHNVIFVDVQDDLQFSTAHYKSVRQATSNQAVVMPVLYGGVSTIENFDLFGDEIVVVDSAHCATPTIAADYTFFSFHPYKPICTSDGGMISTNESEANEYFRDYRNFGRSALGKTYDITQEGFKFYMNNLNATIGLTQLQHYEKQVAYRKNVYEEWAKIYSVLPHDESSSYYFATALVKNATELMEQNQIARHYPLLHQTAYYSVGARLPRSESLHSQILNLPLGDIGLVREL
jgi:dTDP-4-amino-4,6-dideoxygalactose transaminase